MTEETTGTKLPDLGLRPVSQEVLLMQKRTSVYRDHKRRVMRNVIIVSSSFALLFAAFQALNNLQSSINMKEGLGTIGLATIYGFLVLSCMFVPSAMIQRLGYKWTMVVSMIFYVTYIAANFYPRLYTIIPASVVVGGAAAPLWSAKCAYLTESGVYFAKMSRELPEVVISRFFGIFFAVFQSSTVMGNVISSTVLSTASSAVNESEEYDVARYCGVHHCPSNALNKTHLTPPDATKLYILLATYVTLSILAALLLAIFLGSISDGHDVQEHKFDPRQLLATFIQMRSKNQLLLIPITIYSGLQQGYITSEFTQAYISCTLGVWMVGYVMICHGVCDALGSMLVARVNEYLGRPVMFGTAAFLHVACVIGLLLWVPSEAMIQRPIFFILAGAWGLGDAVWQTQINAFYGTVFSEHSEAAFANYRLWESVGFILAFGYSSVLCVRVKTYVTFLTLFLGMVCYAVTEVLWRQEEKKRASAVVPTPPIEDWELENDVEVKTEM